MNHSLETDRKYVKDILGREMFYSIPEYQRPYVWGEEQVGDLLDDFANAFENSEQKDYFLGCMIWNTRKENEGTMEEFECKDILDGQQRFITLFLLHAVIRDRSLELKVCRSVDAKLSQVADEIDGIPGRDRIVFEIREDASFIQKYVLKNGATKQVEALKKVMNSQNAPISNRNMARAISFMHSWWEEKEKERGEEFQAYLTKYFKFISTKVMVLYLATPNNLDDAYNLFTVLNSRGLQLRNGDILRAQNLREIKDDVQRKRYAEKWSEIENAIGPPFKSLDDFLWSIIDIYVKYSSEETASIIKSFDLLERREELYKGTNTIDVLERYANHYINITQGRTSNADYEVFFRNLNTILIETFGSEYLPMMMYYRECFGDFMIEEFLLKIDNLLSTFWLTGRRITKTRIFYILRRIQYHYKQQITGSLTQKEAAMNLILDPALKSDYVQENSRAKALSEEYFFEYLDQEDWGGYAGTKINKTRYLLLKLDLIMTNSHNLIQVNKKRLSVEHLMPRALDAGHWNIVSENHEQWLHKLGNIVLIDRRKNAAISNKSFAFKKDSYKKDIQSRSNTNYVFMEYTDWNIDAIKDNHRRSVELLKEYYQINSLAFLDKLAKV